MATYDKSSNEYKAYIQDLNKEIAQKFFKLLVSVEDGKYYTINGVNNKKEELKNYAGDTDLSYEVVKHLYTLGTYNLYLGYTYSDKYQVNFWNAVLELEGKRFYSGNNCLTLAESICKVVLNYLDNKTEKTTDNYNPDNVIEFPFRN